MNSNIKNIVNVYQLNYANYKSHIGFGDFLRGCFTLIQFCKLHNINYDIYINTPINYFLRNFKTNQTIIDKYNDINYFTEQNVDINNRNLHNITSYYNYDGHVSKFVDYCNTLQINDNTIYLLTNAFPFKNIEDDERKQIQFWIEPNDEMYEYVEINLKQLNLLPYEYEIIHIRTGDDFLVNNNKIDISKLHNIQNTITQYIDKNKKYIFISDNNDLNIHITNNFQNIKAILNEKVHSGKALNDLNSIKNTLLDFYIMSKSNSILSFSVYGHGSSFSKSCAEIYNLPICTHILWL
jgi:hypothetical protein